MINLMVSRFRTLLSIFRVTMWLIVTEFYWDCITSVVPTFGPPKSWGKPRPGRVRQGGPSPQQSWPKIPGQIAPLPCHQSLRPAPHTIKKEWRGDPTVSGHWLRVFLFGKSYVLFWRGLHPERCGRKGLQRLTSELRPRSQPSVRLPSLSRIDSVKVARTVRVWVENTEK